MIKTTHRLHTIFNCFECNGSSIIIKLENENKGKNNVGKFIFSSYFLIIVLATVCFKNNEINTFYRIIFYIVISIIVIGIDKLYENYIYKKYSLVKFDSEYSEIKQKPDVYFKLVNINKNAINDLYIKKNFIIKYGNKSHSITIINVNIQGQMIYIEAFNINKSILINNEGDLYDLYSEQNIKIGQVNRL